MYDPDCSGAVQRKGVVLLREVHSQLLDVAETGAATPVPPVGVGDNLPGVGDSRTEKNVKLEPNSEDKKLRKEKALLQWSTPPRRRNQALALRRKKRSRQVVQTRRLT